MKWLTAKRAADHLPGTNALTLEFHDNDLERDYRATQRDGNLSQVRRSLWLTIILIFAFSLMDPIQVSNHGWTVMILRNVLVNGFIGVMVYLSYREYFRTRWPILLMLSALVFSIFHSVVIGQIGVEHSATRSVVLAVVAIYLIYPLYYFQAIVTGLICTAIFAFLGTLPFPPWEATSEDMILLAQLAAANVLGVFGAHHMEQLRRKDFLANRQIDQERARVKELLERIMPETVAERLEAGDEQVVDQLTEVTVLFADIVGFTDLSAEQSPDATLKLLADVFAEFDQLTEKYGVEKIKTIGDAYMVAAGAPPGTGADASHMASLARDMVQAARKFSRPDGTPVQIRVGIDRGELIAGVIGDSRFLYDLWGDTVNTASRMESTSEAGRIQVTGSVRDGLDPARFPTTSRGEVEIKGKGVMPTWWLEAG